LLKQVLEVEGKMVKENKGFFGFSKVNVMKTKGGDMKLNKSFMLMTLMTLLLISVVSAGNFIIRDSNGLNLLTLDNSTGDFNITSGTISENGVLLSDLYCLLTGCAMSGELNVTVLSVNTSVDFPVDSIAEGDINFGTTCAAGNHLYISGNDLACEADNLGYYNVSNFTSTLTDNKLCTWDASVNLFNCTYTDLDSGADGNNYTTNISISNASTHVVTVGRFGLANLVAQFTDLDTGNCSVTDSCVNVVYNGDIVGFYYNISNFTSTLTDNKICTWDASVNLFNCTYTDISGSGGNTSEEMQDSVLNALIGEDGILYTYDDASNQGNISFDCSEVTDSGGDHLECSNEDLVVSDDFVLNTGDTITTADLVLDAVSLSLTNSANVTGGGSTTMSIDATGNFIITLG